MTGFEVKCPCCGREGIAPTLQPGRHIDLETGIAPVSEWGPECARGWVSDIRFAGRTTSLVIKRKTHKKARTRNGTATV
jgi:hypothetical protein